MKIVSWVFLTFAILSVVNIILLALRTFPYKHCAIRTCIDSDYSTTTDEPGRFFLSLCENKKCIKYKRKKLNNVCMPDNDQDLIVENPAKCLFTKTTGESVAGTLSGDNGTSLKYLLETGESLTHISKITCEPLQSTEDGGDDPQVSDIVSGEPFL